MVQNGRKTAETCLKPQFAVNEPAISAWASTLKAWRGKKAKGSSKRGGLRQFEFDDLRGGIEACDAKLANLSGTYRLGFGVARRGA